MKLIAKYEEGQIVQHKLDLKTLIILYWWSTSEGIKYKCRYTMSYGNYRTEDFYEFELQEASITINKKDLG